MKFEYDKTVEEVRKPVAVIYCSHLVIRGDGGEAIYLCSDSAVRDKAFVATREKFDDVLNSAHPKVEHRFYTGDSITITF